MTENTEKPVENVANGETVAENAITLEQLTVIRKGMVEMFQKNYKKFMESIKELPLHPQFLHQPSLFFDTAALWMKEVIEYSPLIQKNREPEAQQTVQ